MIRFEYDLIICFIRFATPLLDHRPPSLTTWQWSIVRINCTYHRIGKNKIIIDSV